MNKNVQLKSANGQDLLFPKTLVNNVVDSNDQSLATILAAKASQIDLSALQSKIGSEDLSDDFASGISTITQAVNSLKAEIDAIDVPDGTSLDLTSTDGSIEVEDVYDHYDTSKKTGYDIKIDSVDSDKVKFDTTTVSNGQLVEISNGVLKGIEDEDGNAITTENLIFFKDLT